MPILRLDRWLARALQRLDSDLADAAMLHGRYCVSDAKLGGFRKAGTGRPGLGRRAAHKPATRHGDDRPSWSELSRVAAPAGGH